MMRRSSALALLVVALTGTAGAQTNADPIRDASRVQFGLSVAVLDNLLFVGEPSAQGAPGGRVHVYTRTGATWRSSGSPLMREGGAGGLGFGAALAADGNTLLVGMRNLPDSARGGVQVYTRGASGAWTDAGTLGGTPAARSGFGWSLALTGDWAFVGAPNAQPGGAVHVFRRSGGTWSAAGTLPATELNAGDRFGAAIAVDGDRVAVSAPGRDAQKGAVYLFRRGADGSFAAEGMVAGRRVPANSQMGLSLVLAGDQLWAGAPNANGFSGMVVGFTRSSAGAWSEGRTLTPFEMGTSRFGASLAKVGDELLIGAPSDSRSGMIYRVSEGRDGGMPTMTRFTSDSAASGSTFGAILRGNATTLAVGMPGDAGGQGTVAVFAKGTTGSWRMTGNLYPAPASTMAAVTGAERACGNDGRAGGFQCSNASVLSYLPISAIGGRRGTNLNDNWGWTDPQTGREYALVGRTDGTSFVDVTDPVRPRYLGDLPLTQGATPNVWRDMKVYKDHVFIVADGAGPHGVQVFDLTRLRNVRTPQTFTQDAHYDRVGSAHNIVMNEETGFAYAVGVSGGGDTCGGGLHMIDVREPKNPKFAGCFSDPTTGRASTGYSHDAQCVIYRGPDQTYAGREICVGSNETAISISDVTDKANPKALSTASYPAVGYAHQGWLTEDQRYFYLGDELDEGNGQGEAAKGTRTLIFDLADLDDPVLVKEWVGTTPATDHNMYIKGNRMYQANYQAGLRILDISDPINPREVGYLDTTPEGTTAQMSGAWSNYPYFKSGTIVVTSVGEGLFLVRDRTQAVP